MSNDRKRINKSEKEKYELNYILRNNGCRETKDNRAILRQEIPNNSTRLDFKSLLKAKPTLRKQLERKK